MIQNHPWFIDAINEKKKVRVRFYSIADSGVLDRVCAPMDYGPGSEPADGLNRYWLWDYTSNTDTHILGLAPQQIVDLQVLGEGFDPAQFTLVAAPAPVLPADDVPVVKMTPTGGATVPIL
jgi:hypothetical protein